MTDRISVDEIISPEDHKIIIDKASEHAFKALNYIADVMDEVQKEKHHSFVANQFLGIITQHMMKMTIGNAFTNGNEINTVGKLYISAILDGFQLAKNEEALRKQAQESKKEGTH